MDDQKKIPNIISELLRAREPRQIQEAGPSYRHAGVLIPLFRGNGGYSILFTKRTDEVENHKGQISFPGGAWDEDDLSMEETALREAQEEVGLLKEHVEILGRIDDILTLASSFIVHPFVGLMPYPYDFSINSAEVERLIRVPLSVFHPENCNTKKDSVEFKGEIYKIPAYRYGDDLIWGATARMMENLMDIISPKLPLPETRK